MLTNSRWRHRRHCCRHPPIRHTWVRPKNAFAMEWNYSNCASCCRLHGFGSYCSLVWQRICVAHIHFKCKFVHWLAAIAAIRAYVSAEKVIDTGTLSTSSGRMQDNEIKITICMRTKLVLVRSGKPEEWYSVIDDDDCKMDSRGIPRLDAFTIPVILLNDIEMSSPFHSATKGDFDPSTVALASAVMF